MRFKVLWTARIAGEFPSGDKRDESSFDMGVTRLLLSVNTTIILN